jgi:hypothetical protein
MTMSNERAMSNVGKYVWCFDGGSVSRAFDTIEECKADIDFENAKSEDAEYIEILMITDAFNFDALVKSIQELILNTAGSFDDDAKLECGFRYKMRGLLDSHLSICEYWTQEVETIRLREDDDE